MLKNKIKIIAFFLVLFMLFSTTVVLAENETELISDTTQTQEENYKKSDVYLGGDTVTIDYIVDGNAFISAETVIINSQIGGDAFITANKIIIEEQGYIFNNLFAIADSIEIKGVVYDIYSLSETLTISSGYVYRDVKAMCNTLNINTSIGRNVSVACDNINFNTVDGANGVILGNLDYSSNSEISIPENGVNGDVSYTSTSESFSSYLLNLGQFLTFLIVVWLICLWLAPKFLNSTNQYIGKKTLTVIGSGLLTLIAVPAVCIILILLQLTSGISTFYMLAAIISSSLFIITANNYICTKLKIHKKLGIFGILIISGIVVWALTLIPYVGLVISFIISVLGLGILVNSIIPKRVSKHDVVDEVIKVSNNNKK